MATYNEIRVPDIGNAKNIDVIEILVKPGDEIKKDDALVTLESDKASMEIPSPEAGIVKEVKLKVGDKVSEGSVILLLEKTATSATKTENKAPAAAEPQAPAPTVAKEEEPKASESKSTATPPPSPPSNVETATNVHAGPAVRRLARELGVELALISPSGPKGRIVKEDVQNYVKSRLAEPSGGGITIANFPEIDFAKYGEVTSKPLSRIKKLTGKNLHRSWVTVPHVTQFDMADITELEAFRKSMQKQAELENYKLTPLVFIMKAVVASLQKFPQFNASLDNKGENLILKNYFHIGVAVDTPNGLVVPVIRDVNTKGMGELAKELATISNKAREKGLSPQDMEGGCFTISSLGGIGGTAFTPIVNAPEVAILGVSKASQQPVYQNNTFIPRLMLPLSLSYDHRVIDGAEAARFIVYLAELLADVRKLLL